MCVLFFSEHPGVDIESWTSHGTDDVEFVNESAARAQEGRMILHYYVHLLDTGAQGRKYSVHARACACKQEDSGNRIKRAGRRPFEKDENIWWRYREDLLFLVWSLS